MVVVLDFGDFRGAGLHQPVHQFLDQFDRRLHAAVKTNTAIKLVGGLSHDDAREFAREMGCEPEFLQNIRKHETHTEFACMVKNQTPRPLRVSIPFGQMEEQPRSNARARAALIAQNRARYCTDKDNGAEPPPSGGTSPDDDSPLGDPEIL